MNSALIALACAAAYLIGSVPFGFLVARARGIDIRAVGSGNIGATNVGRVLGFRYFWLVFLLDLAKGLLPTWGLPLLVARLTARPAPPGLAVAAALASILGHNFPVYLRFRGGKGVATSLGAVLALDPAAGLAAAVGFTTFLVVCRYVSVSSVGGGIVFALVHFLRVDAPWSREERAMSVTTLALLVLLIVRHRKNFGRIGAGTEPKVELRKPRPKPPAGRVSLAWLVALAVASGAVVLGMAFALRHASKREVLAVGMDTLEEVARVGTGHQRAERVAFADGGRLLAVTCPRYNRLVLYRVTDADRLVTLHDAPLDGKPVAVCPAKDRLYVLLRPPGDRRHVEPGWWDEYDFRGRKLGARSVVGYYPDDMALSPDGRFAFVVTSGRAEGGKGRRPPALDVYETGTAGGGRASRATLTFDGKDDDPARITLSASGRCAAVTLNGSDVAAAVDLFDPAAPFLVGRTPLAADAPYTSRTDGDSIVMPVASGREALLLPMAGVGACVLSTRPKGSGLEVSLPGRNRVLGRLTLHGGATGLGTTRPTGLAYSPERRLIAVANRSGGVHLVAVRPASVAGGKQVAARDGKGPRGVDETGPARRDPGRPIGRDDSPDGAQGTLKR